MMRLWSLRPRDRVAPWGYDCAFHLVVRAESEERARVVASQNASGEGPNAWLDPALSTCEPIEQDGPEEKIAEDILNS